MGLVSQLEDYSVYCIFMGCDSVHRQLMEHRVLIFVVELLIHLDCKIICVLSDDHMFVCVCVCVCVCTVCMYVHVQYV